jgi:hypothetical protein
MADAYTVSTPKITAAVFSKNPCSINEEIVLTVTVIEQSVVLEAETIYTGEIFAGEVR